MTYIPGGTTTGAAIVERYQGFGSWSGSNVGPALLSFPIVRYKTLAVRIFAVLTKPTINTGNNEEIGKFQDGEFLFIASSTWAQYTYHYYRGMRGNIVNFSTNSDRWICYTETTATQLRLDPIAGEDRWSCNLLHLTCGCEANATLATVPFNVYMGGEPAFSSTPTYNAAVMAFHYRKA